MELDQWLHTELGRNIWKSKYQYNNETLEEWFDRVSGGNQNIRQLIKEQKFLFGGRILANRGLYKYGVKASYSNCYTTKVEDNLESIFDCGKRMARTFSMGGGEGVDISKLRPNGAPVHNSARTTSGAVSFMDFFSFITEIIGTKGRRAALMICMDCTHPDIEEFITVKSDLNRVTKANISVKITDQFMQKAINREDITLSYTMEDGSKIEKVVNAGYLLDLLAKNNWDYAEPGMLFWNTAERYNLLSCFPNFHYDGVNPLTINMRI